MIGRPKNKLKFTVIVLLSTVAVISLLGGIYINGIRAVDPENKKEITVSVPRGSGASAIVEILDSKDLVRNKTVAKIQARIGGYDSLQANTYVFDKSMSLTEMFRAIDSGDFKYISKRKFTIVEGATVPQVAEAISKELPYTKKEIIRKWRNKDFLKSLIEKYDFLTDEILSKDILFPLEGYIYPETYFITDEDPTLESITLTILKKTGEELSSRKDDIDKNNWNVHEFLSLASVVENESLFDKDRSKISGVFINRLKKGMALQSDITVLYALQEKRVDVTYEDLKVESKYNTYLHKGLPVGPVCAVPAKTMDAVLKHEEHDYYYFFATKEGKVLYSKTAKEHEKIVGDNLWY